MKKKIIMAVSILVIIASVIGATFAYFQAQQEGGRTETTRGGNYVNNTYAVRPVFYLLSTTKVTSGTGEELTPYRLVH